MDNKFKEWLVNDYGLKKSAANSRASNIATIEKYYGDIDIILTNSSIGKLLNDLSYSCADERRKELPKHKIPISGNIRTGSATLKQALSRYIEFYSAKYNHPTLSINSTKLEKIRDVIQHELTQFKIQGNPHSFRREDVRSLIQEPIARQLSKILPYIKWDIEYKLSPKVKDSIDIFGAIDETSCVVIEIDTVRVDQICKKFVSRQALTDNMNCLYVIVTYPNTNSKYKADKAAIPKFERYMNTISNLLSHGSNLEKHILIHNL